MSASHRGSPIATITTSVIAALVLYVGTWPVVEIKCRVPIHWVKLTSGGGSITTVTGSYRPVSTEVLYRPLHALRACNGYHNPLHLYWNWWMNRIGPKYSL